MKIRTIIIDDEALGRENLLSILKDYFFEIEVVAQADSSETAIPKIDTLQPDLLFLDMDLGLNTGLDLLQHYADPKFEVIFVTAYDQYAVKAFRTVASDYLLKPIDIDELKDAIGKVSENIEYKRLKKLDHKTNAARESMVSPTGFIKISTHDGIEMIAFKDILYLQSINYYTNLVLTSGREIITTRHLKDYEEQLKDYKFFRVHNSYIINTIHLKGVKSKEGYTATLLNDISIKISRRRKDDFLKFIDSQRINFTEF